MHKQHPIGRTHIVPPQHGYLPSTVTTHDIGHALHIDQEFLHKDALVLYHGLRPKDGTAEYFLEGSEEQ